MKNGFNFILLTALALYSVIALSLLVLNQILTPQTSYIDEKNSPYECGFDPFTNIRERTSIHFYLVSILFLIFDIEITFLFPWAISLAYMNIATLIGY